MNNAVETFEGKLFNVIAYETVRRPYGTQRFYTAESQQGADDIASAAEECGLDVFVESVDHYWIVIVTDTREV